MEAWTNTVIGVIVGVVGLVAAFLFYRRSRVRPRLVYQYQALKLIGKVEPALPEEVKILYQKKGVPRLTRTHIILWNSGKAPVRREDIARHGAAGLEVPKLRFKFNNETQVLRLDVLKETNREANKFEAEVNPNYPNEVSFSFDYLDERDGVTLEILHTDEEGYPEVQGSIIGQPKGISDWGKFVFPHPTPVAKWVLGIMTLFILALWTCTVIVLLRADVGVQLRIILIAYLGLSAGFGIFPWQFWRQTRERFPKILRVQ